MATGLSQVDNGSKEIINTSINDTHLIGRYGRNCHVIILASVCVCVCVCACVCVCVCVCVIFINSSENKVLIPISIEKGKAD